MKTVLAIIAEARDKYTVHECSECTCRKSCDMNAYGFDTPECKGKRESIALALGVDDGYFTQILDRLEAAAKRDRTEIEANALAIGGVVETSRKKHSGNAAELREALLKAIVLLQACEWPDDAPMQDITEVMDEIEKALSAPPRNCDRFRDWDSAEAEYERLVQEGKAEDGNWCEGLFSVGQYASAQEGAANA